MKAVILLAGKGRRLGELAKIRHKSLIVLGDKPLLGHLIDGLLYCGLDEIIPIVGHNKEEVLKYLKDNYSNKITISPVINPKYKTANNMVSLWCAKHFLNNKAFILLNGDLVLNKLIIKKVNFFPIHLFLCSPRSTMAVAHNGKNMSLMSNEIAIFM